MKRLFFLLLLLTLHSCAHRESPDDLVAIQIQDRNDMTETISSPERLEKFQKEDFFSSHPYKKVLRVYKKEGKNHAKITTYHPNGQVWQYLEAQELRALGAYREWYPNGQLRLEAKVLGGTADVAQGVQNDWLFDDVSTVWDEKGNRIAEILYQNGDLHGLSTYYYPSGQIERQEPYLRGNLEGVVTTYYASGKLRSKTHFVQGKKEGPSLGYFSSGEICWSETFSNSLLVQGAYFSPTGKQIAEVVDGMGFQALYSGEKLSFLAQIFQGSIEGSVQQFDEKENCTGTYFLKNGMKHGEETGYYIPTSPGTAPQLHFSIQWDKDKIHGSVKTWYPGGQIESQREFARNKRNGNSLSWYLDGSLMSIEEYEEDKLTKGQYYKRHEKDPISSVFNGSGVATLYDEEGVFLKKVIYSKGEIVDPEE